LRADAGKAGIGGENRCPELVSKWPGEDEDHAEVEEGEVVVGFAVAAGGDAAFGFQPGVGTFDGPALTGERVWGFRLALAAAPDLAPRRAGWEWVAGAAAFADPGFDLAGAQGVFELFGVVAAVGPELAGLDPATGECVQEREQVAAFVFVPGGQPDFERLPVAIDG